MFGLKHLYPSYEGPSGVRSGMSGPVSIGGILDVRTPVGIFHFAALPKKFVTNPLKLDRRGEEQTESTR